MHAIIGRAPGHPLGANAGGRGGIADLPLAFATLLLLFSLLLPEKHFLLMRARSILAQGERGGAEHPRLNHL